MAKALSKCCDGKVLEFYLYPQQHEKWKRDWGEDIGPAFKDVTVCYRCHKKCEVEYSMEDSEELDEV